MQHNPRIEGPVSRHLVLRNRVCPSGGRMACPRWRALLVKLLSSLALQPSEERIADNCARMGISCGGAAARKTPDLHPETIEALKAMGYLEGEE